MERGRDKEMQRGKRMLVLMVWLFGATFLFADGQGGTDRKDDMYLGGQPNAPVRIEVFSDFQCPVCRAFYLETVKPMIADLTKERKIDRVCVVYHDFPLDMHPYARKAASYAVAARQVSRDAWLRVIDALYQEQAKWSQDGNIDAALSKALDPAELARIKKLSTDPIVDQTIRSEVQLGQSREITMTPTFFIITESGRQERTNGGVAYMLLKGRLEQLLK